MADRRFTLVLYVAILTAAAATFGVYRVLQSNKEQNRVPMRPVVVTTQDLPEGAVLPREALQVAQWPAAAAPEGAFGAVDSLVGRVTRVAVFKGEAVVPGRLTPVGTGGGLEVKIAPGKRAMSIRINDVSGIAGLVQPNSRVDLLLMTAADPGTGQSQQVAKLFMENMKVLSIGTQLDRGTDGRPAPAAIATLEVTPEEAETIGVVQKTGEIQLVLRGYGENDSTKTRGAISNDVLARIRGDRAVGAPVAAMPAERREAPRRPAPVVREASPAAPVATPVVTAPKPDSVSVQVYRGNAVVQHKFQVDSGPKKP